MYLKWFYIFGILLLAFNAQSQSTTPENEVYSIQDSLLQGSFMEVYLPDLIGWKFSPYDHPEYSSPDYDDSSWYTTTTPLREESAIPDSLWNGFGWFRLKVKMDSDELINSIIQNFGGTGAIEFYINDSLVFKKGNPSVNPEFQELKGFNNQLGDLYTFEKGENYQFAVKYSYHDYNFWNSFSFNRVRHDFGLSLISVKEINEFATFIKSHSGVNAAALVVLLMVMLLHFFLYRKSKIKDGNFWIFLITASIFIYSLAMNVDNFWSTSSFFWRAFLLGLTSLFSAVSIGLIPIVSHKVLEVKAGFFWKYFLHFILLSYLLDMVYRSTKYFEEQINLLLSLALVLAAIVGGITASIKAKKKKKKDIWLVAGSLITFPFLMLLGIVFIFFNIQHLLLLSLLYFFLFTIIPIGMSLYQGKKFLRMHSQLDAMVEERTSELEQAMKNLRQSHEDLKAAQTQLVQQEKLASLGQLTAGIAHEIKNPLNFVTNFSDVCLELVEEAKTELRVATKAQVPTGERNGIDTLLDNLQEILQTIETNLQKIYEHGNRADGIVKSMLLHSRGGSGKMELTDLNSVVKEYVNLAYHGMRASKNPIDVVLEFDLDIDIKEIPLVAEDFSRVILNLCNNAFDAMREKTGEPSYKPVLRVRTGKQNSTVLLSIGDNGRGIDPKIADHILQPFFTTKKGTDGTGLGLSLSNEIVQAHGGEIKVESTPGKGAKFIVVLPTSL
ncbi:His Kinase A (phospho-acceptor) domain-containing protein [Salinimicrobium sediminis]|uniref:histidine kinase n=1 Tax=Salinimicrobium sediminis TaxID=1343891 RepID=A0A285X700_9FLAO|nr:ATP-binding protein [Salinimicrobium sediminis]SOC81102.1 His Kinase A (phospho-acceptor) domain-containing protein [Salinimicrobium sediminis]